jgi:hypothetical protein
MPAATVSGLNINLHLEVTSNAAQQGAGELLVPTVFTIEIDP